MWPQVPEPSASLAAAREYVRSTSSAITSAEAAQLKRKDKGKNIAYDPKKPKRLAVYAASAFPAWQDKYVELVRKEFDTTKLSEGGSGSNDKDLAARVSKMAKEGNGGPGETKKAMPFVQGMRRRLAQGEAPNTVLMRELGFDEGDVLREMAKGLRKTTGCTIVEVVKVDATGKSGSVLTAVSGDGEGVKGAEGEKREALPGVAEVAVPGVPTFHFANIEA